MGARCTPVNLTSLYADVCLVREEVAYKLDHVILKGLRFLGRSSGLCEQGKESGEGGRCGWGEVPYGASRSFA